MDYEKMLKLFEIPIPKTEKEYCSLGIKEYERLSQIEEGAEKIFDAINIMTDFNRFVKLAVYAISKQHRTLQQKFIKLIFSIIREYAKTEYCDGRNEDSVELCKKTMNLLESNDITYKGEFPIRFI